MKQPDFRPPDPFVPAEVDLNGYEFMPLYGERLRTSDHNSGCGDAEFRASINLWWSAWLQVPAASLPSDDIALCKLADLGRDIKAWRKVKAVAMRNFVLCSDGRYYHTFLAPLAVEAWQARVKARVKGKAGAVKRWSKAGAVDNRSSAKGSECHSHPKHMPQPSGIDASTIKNDSKGEESLSRNSVSRRDSAPDTATANPEKTASTPAAYVGRSTYETRILEAGKTKGLTPRVGESMGEFEARVRTARV